MKKEINHKVPVIFQNLKEYESNDSRFVKVKIWLMHVNSVNLNNSYFSKEVVNENLYTLANTPILAFIEDNSQGESDFSDHRIVLERNDDDIKLSYKGSAIGIIPETNNAKWETRVTDSGEELEYLTVEGLLWTKWDDPVDIMSRKQFTSQSMELHHDGIEGYYDANGIYHFTKFSFFGACLLGDDVLPAMQNSTVELQFSSKQDIKKTIEDKLNEFNTLFSVKGGNNLEDVKQEFEETPIETTESEVFETENVADKEVDDVEENPTQEVETEEAQVEEAPTQEESKEEVETFTKEFVEGLNAQIESLNGELNELKTYKRQREESDLASKFADKLSVDEINEVFELSKEFSIEQVEEKLLVLFGKKNFSLTKENEKPVSKVNIQYQKDDEDYNPYKAFFSK